MVVDATTKTDVIHSDRARGGTRPWLRGSTDADGARYIISGGAVIEIDVSQAWFWSEGWQAGEREVDEYIRNGEVEEFDSLEDFFDSL